MDSKTLITNCRTAVVSKAKYLATMGHEISVYDAQLLVDELAKTMEKWQRAEDDAANETLSNLTDEEDK